jgi:hypothetical protein
MIVVWMLMAILCSFTWQRNTCWNWGSNWETSKRSKTPKPLWGADHDNKAASWAGPYKDSLNHHWLFYCCNLWMWQSGGLHVCYKWMTMKLNQHFCIFSGPSRSFTYPSQTDILLSFNFRNAYKIGSRNCHVLHICYQWNGILLHHWKSRNQSSKNVNNYSYRWYLFKWKN